MRKAVLQDIQDIMNIIRGTISEMRTYQNTQWDESYPQQRDFENDIKRGELYVEEQGGKLVGFVCANKIEPDGYKTINWTWHTPSMVLHRMAVDPACRRQGIGMRLMAFSEKLASEHDICYLKTDTYSINDKMNALFKKCGYRKVGEISFNGKELPFNCYEKMIKQ